MKIAVDTNVLVRAIVGDDARQCKAAIEAMAQAEVVAISVHALCELVWVLRRSYEVSRADIAAAIGQLLDTRNVLVNRPAVEAGLAVLMAGGDFANGVIALEGRWLGGDTFVSFDQKAVALLTAEGHAARSL
ncbi:MAG: type II toxin-antitoxin system VapC family toxin [Lysobacterales bacterium]